MSKASYTVGELAEAAQVTTRTIRYYVSEELLPSPESGGRAATYTDEHLARLKLIKILKDEFLPLQEIRSLLAGLGYRAVIELLAEKQKIETPAPPTSNSAKEYLQTLLHPPEAPEQAATLMRHKVKAQQQRKKTEGRYRQIYEEKEIFVDEFGQVETKEGIDRPAGADSSRLMEAEAVGVAKPDQDQSAVTRWQRIPITSDVELHIREGTENNNLWQKIDRLIKVARQILSSVL